MIFTTVDSSRLFLFEPGNVNHEGIGMGRCIAFLLPNDASLSIVRKCSLYNSNVSFGSKVEAALSPGVMMLNWKSLNIREYMSNVYIRLRELELLIKQVIMIQFYK